MLHFQFRPRSRVSTATRPHVIKSRSENQIKRDWYRSIGKHVCKNCLCRMIREIVLRIGRDRNQAFRTLPSQLYRAAE